MKKCCYCHKDLQGSNGITCEKCKANEAKYGKPGVCKYCQLPAAFLDEKCVHCSYGERKHGPPVACSKCQLKCAFPKSPSLKNKPILCRLCMHPTAASTSASGKLPSSSSSSSKKRPSSSSHGKRATTTSALLTPLDPTATSATATTAAAAAALIPPIATAPGGSAKKSRRDSFDHHVDAGAEHILTIQQLKDTILDQTRTIQLRDKLLQEKDQKIAELNADLLRRDRDHRQKVLSLEKRSNDMLGPLREQVKTLTRQVTQLQKITKTTGSTTIG